MIFLEWEPRFALNRLMKCTRRSFVYFVASIDERRRIYSSLYRVPRNESPTQSLVNDNHLFAGIPYGKQFLRQSFGYLWELMATLRYNLSPLSRSLSFRSDTTEDENEEEVLNSIELFAVDLFVHFRLSPHLIGPRIDRCKINFHVHELDSWILRFFNRISAAANQAFPATN